ncbi:MAG: lipid-A-disaccharide synthase N-terminal domain-containing protein [Planctomycetes bacterium]|nr:lipid-A-disaccharide synthase N-terminal domain-containing protein [Planctomycetota bacterium]
MTPADSASGFLGFTWDAWTAIGLFGQSLFAVRFAVQWAASEVRKESVVPISFWWISIAASLISLAYFVRRWELVGISGSLFNSIVYVRNLQLIHGKKLRETPPAAPAD